MVKRLNFGQNGSTLLEKSMVNIDPEKSGLPDSITIGVNYRGVVGTIIVFLHS